MQKIYLIGFMGSGKSTIGKALARKLGKSYVDTDTFIEEKYGSIPEIFKNEGEETFRLYEIEALKATTTYDVISTGGGIVEKEENIQTMKKHGMIIYLHTSFKEISERLELDENRPLWNQDHEEKQKLFERRIPLYKKCSDHIVSTDHKSIEEVVEEIIAFVNV